MFVDCYASPMVDVGRDDDLESTLFHYTDFRALQSIYEKGEVWATNSRYLNDLTETRLGPAAIINTLRDREKAENDEITRYLDEVPEGPLEEEHRAYLREVAGRRNPWSELRGACDHALTDTTCFIFSLSRVPDQLSQSRAYAKDGVCVEFVTDELLTGLTDAPVKGADVRRLNYFDGGNIDAEYLDPIVDFMKERRVQLIGEGCTDVGLRDVVIGQELMLKIAFLKDIHFQEEKEVRIAVQGNPNHFTPNRYGLMPRIKLPITPYAIRSVIVGPGAHAELRAQSLHTFFEEVSFKTDPVSPPSEIEVYESAVPYRDW